MHGEGPRRKPSQFVPQPARDDSLLPREHLKQSNQKPTGSGLGSPCTALRANPFPKVTDLFCRLPLPTLFHRPEAVQFGNLMRSNGEPVGQHPKRADAKAHRRNALPAIIKEMAFQKRIKSPGFGLPQIPAGSRPESIGGPARRHSTSDRGASPAPIHFSFDNFNHSLTLFSTSFSSFHYGTSSLLVSPPYLALDGIHCPIWAVFPNNPTHRKRFMVRQGSDTMGLSPSMTSPSRGIGPCPPLRTLLQTVIQKMEPPDSKDGLFLVRSPLLRESFAMVPWCIGAWCHGDMVQWCLGSLVPWYHGALVPWCHGALVPWCHGALLPWCLGAMVSWCHGALVPWCHSALVPRCHGATVPRFLGAFVSWCIGATVTWCHGSMVSWCLGSMVPRCHSATVPWYLGALMPRCMVHDAWCHGFRVPWCHGAMVPCCTVPMVVWGRRCRCTDIQLNKDTTMVGHYMSIGICLWTCL
ncbi:Protein TAR1 [Capsicum chinense]|nr:Protein TAR1 [Capsicum chinense]